MPQPHSDLPPMLVPIPHARAEDSGVTFIDPPHDRVIPAELVEDEGSGIVFIN